MTFMYLVLHTEDEKIHAKVVSRGSLQFSSLGGPNSRSWVGPGPAPFAVLQIEAFDGLESVQDADLLGEIMRRKSTKELQDWLIPRIPTDELFELLRKRVKP